MKINVLNQNITDFRGDVVIVNLFQNMKALSGATRSIDKKLGGLITKLIADREITGKLGETAVFIFELGFLYAWRKGAFQWK